MKNESAEYPIKPAPGYQVGEVFVTTLIAAQIEALRNLIPSGGVEKQPLREEIISFIAENPDRIIAILAPPKELRQRVTRKDKGTKRKKAMPTTTTATT